MTTKLKDLWHTIRAEEHKKAKTGIGGAVLVDDEFEAAMRFAEHFHQSKIDAITDEMIEDESKYRQMEGADPESYAGGARWLKQELKK